MAIPATLPQTKLCTYCQRDLPVASYSRASYRADGLQYKCKDCVKQYSNLYRLTPKGSALKKQNYRDYYSKQRSLQLRIKFNMSVEDYNVMFAAQNGCCAICTKHQSEFKRALCVDHCHATNRIRGLLCSTCNTSIGLLKDSPENAMRAADYLRKA